jgi:predicted RND superfamily exporter protein
MMATYGLFGVIANVAVCVNVVMIFGLLSLLDATLTLPGIAGIVLTIGIAVDSNVLIYERIREESRNGRSPVNAIENGFKRALATILDSNISTLIAACILFFVGSGPVRGFAVTLGAGIVTTLFTAFSLTRMIIAWWVWEFRPRARAHMTLEKAMTISSEMTSLVPRLREYRSNEPQVCAPGMRAPVLQTHRMAHDRDHLFRRNAGCVLARNRPNGNFAAWNEL